MSPAQTENHLFLRALRREPTPRVPVWLMRQAGRADPAYRRLRERNNLPLDELFRRPDLAAEISLLPERFGVDAIILFQDILTPLAPMGAAFRFRPGPVLEDPVREERDVERLTAFDPADALPVVGETIGRIRRALAGRLPLIGFAGAPLTLACFLIEGKSPGRDPDTTRRMMRDRPDVLHRLLAKLAESTAAYLSYQIDCGVEAVQLFESAADLLSPEAYRTFALPYQREVFERIGDRVPRILFAREFADLEAMVASGADCLSVGTCVDLREARDRFGNRVALQGNVNNRLLLDGPGERIEEAVRACIEATGGYGHILNLNHGLLPETPPEHVSRFIEAARRVSVADRQPVGG